MATPGTKMLQHSPDISSPSQPNILSVVPDLWVLWADSLGDPEICVAVLDGPVDVSHPCFQGASLKRLDTLVSDAPGTGVMSCHGTHVTSVIFGQPNGPVLGVAPYCQGFLLPVFRDFHEGRLSQLDLARAIEQAVQEGAHIINISGGERSPQGQADEVLARAIRLCNENNVLVVAAVGNDGCECLHVPAALPAVLAVGAMSTNDVPLNVSNWGQAYRSNGILGPGENIPGAVPGGRIAKMTGSSFATPIVAGLAGLLLSIQKKNGEKLDPRAVGRAIIESAHKCDVQEVDDCRRYLSGVLNISGAHALIKRGGKKTMSTSNSSHMTAQNSEMAAVRLSAATSPGVVPAGVEPSDMSQPACSALVSSSSGTAPMGEPVAPVGVAPSGTLLPPTPVAQAVTSPAQVTPTLQTTASGVIPSGNCGCGNGSGKKQNVFAIGTISYDFGTEARRDTFRQLMPFKVVTRPDGSTFSQPPNPYDPTQVYNYLEYVDGQRTWQQNSDYSTNDVIADPNGNNQIVTSAGKSGDKAPDWNPVFGETTTDGDKKTGVTWKNAGPSALWGGRRPNLAESTKLIWTLNLELTPIFALVAEVPYADDVYRVFRSALFGETLAQTDANYVGRVSVPGVLTGKTVRLFSGQEIPEVKVQPRGLWTWNVNALTDAVVSSINARQQSLGLAVLAADDEKSVRQFMQNYLDKLYYQLRNLGQSSPDRALNYSATNAFQAAEVGATAINPSAWGLVPELPGQKNYYTLDTVSVSKSPYCRMDSDCWDVQLVFFDPANIMQARLIFQFTVDVSDELPVTMGPVRKWTSAAGVTLRN